MTEEALKMAKIAGMDYATAADYLTTAINGFKIATEDASMVTDTWSALAANTAVSTSELAVAISKTASSAESVGASFQSTSAMIATMTAATRESATSIGTSLKSIISRVGELKANTNGIYDDEGELVSFNRVDTALRSVGVSLTDEAGQMRDFDDIILDLGESWDQLDRNAQRYVATMIAGNRQQPRFLALTSNIDKYKENLSVAENSEGTGDAQALKTFDSIETKVQLIKTEFQSIYRDNGIEDKLKSILDYALKIVRNLRTNLKGNLTRIITFAIGNIKTIRSLINKLTGETYNRIRERLRQIDNDTNKNINTLEKRLQKLGERFKSMTTDLKTGEEATSTGQAIGNVLTRVIPTLLQAGGLVLEAKGLSTTNSSRSDTNVSGIYTGIGQMLSGFGTTFSTVSSMGAPVWVSALVAAASQIPTLIQTLGNLKLSYDERLELAAQEVQAAKEEYLTNKSEFNDLQSAYNKLVQLKDAQYESAEAAEEYTEHMNQIAENYDGLTVSLDAEGNAIVDLTSLEQKLTDARIDSAQAAYDLAIQEANKSSINVEKYQEAREEASQKFAVSTTSTNGTWSLTSANPNAQVYNTLGLQDDLNEILYNAYTTVLKAKQANPNITVDAQTGRYNFDQNSEEYLAQELIYGLLEKYLLQVEERYTKIMSDNGNVRNSNTLTREDYDDSGMVYPILGTYGSTYADVYTSLFDDTQGFTQAKIQSDGTYKRNFIIIDPLVTQQDAYDTIVNSEYVSNSSSTLPYSFTTDDGIEYQYNYDDKNIKDNFIKLQEISGIDFEDLFGFSEDSLDEWITAINSNAAVKGHDVNDIQQSFENGLRKIWNTYEQAVISNADDATDVITAAMNKKVAINYDTSQSSKVINLLSSRAQQTIKENFNAADWKTKTDDDGNFSWVDSTGTGATTQESYVDLASGIMDDLYDENKFSELQREAVLETIADLKSLSVNAAKEKLKSTGLETNQHDLYDKIFEELEYQQELINNRITDFVVENIDTITNIGLFDFGRTNVILRNSDNLSAELKSGFIDDMNSIIELYENGSVSQAEQASEALKQSVVSLNETELSSTTRGQLQAAISEVDFSSREDVQTLLDTVNDMASNEEYDDKDKTILNDLGEELTAILSDWNRSLQLVFSSAIDTLVSVSESTTELIDTLSEGQTLEKMVANLNVVDDSLNLDTFAKYNAESGKWDYTAEGFAAMYENYNEQREEVMKRTADVYEKISSFYADFNDDGTKELVDNLPQTAGIDDQLYNEILAYRENDEIVAGPGSTGYGAAMESAYNLARKAFGGDTEISEDFVKFIITADEAYETVDKAVKAYAELASVDAETARKLYEDAAKIDLGQFLPNVDINKYYSDSEYKAEIDENLKTIADDVNGGILDYVKAAEEYVSFEVRQNLAKGPSEAISTGLDEITNGFGKTISEDTYDWLKGILDKDIFNQIVDENGILKLGDFGSISLIQEVYNSILSTVSEEGSQAEIAAELMMTKLQEVLQNTGETLASGIKGELTYEQKQSLIRDSNGSVTDANFSSTATGYQLDVEGAQAYYQYIRESGASIVTLRNVASSLAEVIGETNDDWRDSSAVIAHIVDLERQLEAIRNSDDSNMFADERKKLEEELQYARDIKEQMDQADGGYAFMDNDISQDIQNPTDYWESLTTAERAISQAKEDGIMDINDYTNIVKQAAAAMQAGGATIAQAQAFQEEALTAGYKSLTSLDGEVGVSLSKLGETYEGGLDTIAGNFDSGIKSIAEQQIKLLDAQIEMVEALMAIDEAGKYDKIHGDTLWNQLSNGFDNTDTGIADFLSDISKITGYSLDDLTNWFENFEWDATNFLEFYTGFVTALKSGDPDAVKQFLSSFTNGDSAAFGDITTDALVGKGDHKVTRVVGGNYGDYTPSGLNDFDKVVEFDENDDRTTKYSGKIGNDEVTFDQEDYNEYLQQKETLDDLSQSFGIDLTDKGPGGKITKDNIDDKDKLASSLMGLNAEGYYQKNQGENLQYLRDNVGAKELKKLYQNSDNNSFVNSVIDDVMAEDGAIEANASLAEVLDVTSKMDLKVGEGGKVILYDDPYTGEKIATGKTFDSAKEAAEWYIEQAQLKAQEDAKAAIAAASAADENGATEGNSTKTTTVTNNQNIAILNSINIEAGGKLTITYTQGGKEHKFTSSSTFENEQDAAKFLNSFMTSHQMLLNFSNVDLTNASEFELGTYASSLGIATNTTITVTNSGVTVLFEDGSTWTPGTGLDFLSDPDAISKILDVWNYKQNNNQDNGDNTSNQTENNQIELPGASVDVIKEYTVNPQITYKQLDDGTYEISAFGETGVYSKGESVNTILTDLLNKSLSKAGLGTTGIISIPANEDGSGVSVEKIINLDEIRFTYTDSNGGIVSGGLSIPINKEAITQEVSEGINAGLNPTGENTETTGITVSIDTDNIIQQIRDALEKLDDPFVLKVAPESSQEETNGAVYGTNYSIQLAGATIEVDTAEGLTINSLVDGRNNDDDKSDAGNTNTPAFINPLDVFKTDSGTSDITLQESAVINAQKGVIINDTSKAETTVKDNTDTESSTISPDLNLSGVTSQLDTLAKNADSASDDTKKFNDALSKTNKKMTDAKQSFDSFTKKSYSIDIDVNVEAGGTGEAAGNVKITKVQGGTLNGSKANFGSTAFAKGTLMGELGPELVVSNGHYYTVGNNGAEMVNLPDDAIVFNHLQTASLLGNGSIGGRGRPVKSEQAAVAFATGNAHANSNAAELLASLKEARAAWQSILDADLSAIGALAGSGGGGGGGGGGGSESDWYGFLEEFERWYNLLRQIEHAEQQINLEEAKRKNLVSGYNQDGYAYADSLKESLEWLKAERAEQEELNELRQSYYDERRKDLEESDYSKIFTYNESGLMQYVDGTDRGLDILAKLNRTDANGTAVMTAKEQVEYLTSLGFSVSDLEYGTDGKKTKKKSGSSEYYQELVQNFFDKAQAWQDEIDDLWDNVADGEKAIEEDTSKINEIMDELTENQINLEKELYTSLTNIRQGQIDAMKNELSAIKEASTTYTKGLTEALNKEKQMYEDQNDEKEITSLQRQIAILQRTGGSASEIKSLQDELDDKMQESYFNEQQSQIDSLTEAAENQQNDLQKQIDLMTEQLEFEKKTGILWQQVYDIMDNGEGAMYDTLVEGMNMSNEESEADFEDYLDEWLNKIQIFLGLSKEAAEETNADTKKDQEQQEKTVRQTLDTSTEDGMNAAIAAGTSSEALKKLKQYQDAQSNYTDVLKAMGLNDKDYKTAAKVISTGGNSSQAQNVIDRLTKLVENESVAKNTYGMTNEQYNQAKNILELLKEQQESGKVTGVTKGKGLNNVSATVASDEQSALALLSSAYGLEDMVTDATEIKELQGYASDDSLVNKASKNMGKVKKGNYFVITGFNANLADFASNPDKFQYKYYDPKTGQVQEATATFKNFNNAMKDQGLTMEAIVEKLRGIIASDSTDDATKKKQLLYSNIKLKQFATGGLIDFTGPAWVDGTKSKPESILSSADTSLLQSLLSNSTNSSLSSLIGSIHTLTEQISENTASDGTSIYGDINLTIQSGVIADDYDAKRAGQMALEEIMKIARKSGNISIKRG